MAEEVKNRSSSDFLGSDSVNSLSIFSVSVFQILASSSGGFSKGFPFVASVLSRIISDLRLYLAKSSCKTLSILSLSFLLFRICLDVSFVFRVNRSDSFGLIFSMTLPDPEL